MEWLEFLGNIGTKQGLSSKQTETLKELFPEEYGETVEQKWVGERLGIGVSMVKERMKQVYKKFEESCPKLKAKDSEAKPRTTNCKGKVEILHLYLRQEYLKFKVKENIYPPKPKSLITGFEALIEEKTKRFCGRKFVFEEFNKFINENSQGYFTVIGEPGAGKSAIAAKYVKDNQVIHYFNELTVGCNTPDDFLNKIREQISHYYQLENTDRDDLKTLLEKAQAQAKLSAARPLIIVIDALDEVTNTEPGHNILDLPQHLPEQVYFLLTRRPYTAKQKKLLVAPSVAMKELDLRKYQQFNREDITEYITTYIDDPEYQEKFQLWMQQKQCYRQEFIQTLADKSQNNFIYLYYVLPDIAEGKLDDLPIQQLPDGLEQYYFRQSERLGNLSEEMSNELKFDVQDVHFIDDDENKNQESLQVVEPETTSPDINIERIRTRIVFPPPNGDCIKQSQPFSLQQWVTILVNHLKSHADTAELLQVSDNCLREIIGGYERHSPELKRPGRIESIKKRINKFITQEIAGLIPNAIDIFQINPNDFSGLPTANSLANVELQKLCQSISSVYQQYSVNQHLKNLIVQQISNSDFEDTKQKNKIRKESLPNIYTPVAILIPPSQFAAYSRISFESQPWENLIHTSQVDKTYHENHLHYSNAWMAEKISVHLRSLMKNDRYRDSLRGGLRILEGGVGGANTTQMVLRGLKELWEKEQYERTERTGHRLKVQYLGYEINPAFVARLRDFFQGKVDTDSRSSFLSHFPLEPWDRQDELVIAQDMVEGIQRLEQDESYHKSVHIFVCSYAFHHVPNGKDFKDYLFFQENQIRRQNIANIFAQKVENLLFGNDEYTRLDEIYQLGNQAKSFTEYVRNPSHQDENDIKYLCRNLSELLNRDASEDVKNRFINEFLIDPKLETLRKIRNLLVPGGILMIADPDGMSNFNAEKILQDPEMVVAHFLKIDEITELLSQARFENIRKYIVGKTRDEREKYRFDIVEKPGNLVDFEDDNLGYIIFAQRPFN